MTMQITKADLEAIHDAAEVIRQVLKGNTAHDGYEVRQALKRLERIQPVPVSQNNGGDAA